MRYSELASLPYGTLVWIDGIKCYTVGEMETEGITGVYLEDEATQERNFLVERDEYVLEWQRRAWRTTLWDSRHHMRRA